MEAMSGRVLSKLDGSVETYTTTIQTFKCFKGMIFESSTRKDSMNKVYRGKKIFI